MKTSFRFLRVTGFVSLMLLSASCLRTQDPVFTTTQPKLYDWHDLVVGADLSSVTRVEAANSSYTDSAKHKDAFLLFRQHGCNVARIRLFHNPSAQGGYNLSGFSGIQDVITSIQRAKQNSLAVELDIHFSDTLATSGKQRVPTAWSGLTVDVLKDSVYNYVYSVLTVLKNRNATPEMIQLGSEIESGIMFPAGAVNGSDYTALATLLNKGIQAVRDFGNGSPIKPLIILHSGEPDNVETFFTGIKNAGVTDFDVVGISYYEEFSSLTMAQISSKIPTWRTNYGKKVLVVETSYQWTDMSEDNKVHHAQVIKNGFEVSSAGQFTYMATFTQNMALAKGMGIIAQDAAWISTKEGFGAETIAFFDFKGNALRAVDYFNYNYVF